VGFPIRKSADQSSFAAPHGLSQRITSFIASQRQGIHRMLLRHLIVLMIDVRNPKGSGTRSERPLCLPNRPDLTRTIGDRTLACCRMSSFRIYSLFTMTNSVTHRRPEGSNQQNLNFRDLVEPDGIEPTT
jgi:hypothetical protein